MKTILLAEDNLGAAALCQVELEDEGYRVVLAADGEQACRAVQERAPDVAVLDISMPGIDGLQALARIRETFPDLPVILFTGFDEDCVTDPRAGLATACVEKSGDLTELKRAIARALAYGRPNELRLGLP